MLKDIKAAEGMAAEEARTPALSAVRSRLHALTLTLALALALTLTLALALTLTLTRYWGFLQNGRIPLGLQSMPLPFGCPQVLPHPYPYPYPYPYP